MPQLQGSLCQLLGGLEGCGSGALVSILDGKDCSTDWVCSVASEMLKIVRYLRPASNRMSRMWSEFATSWGSSTRMARWWCGCECWRLTRTMEFEKMRCRWRWDRVTVSLDGGDRAAIAFRDWDLIENLRQSKLPWSNAVRQMRQMQTMGGMGWDGTMGMGARWVRRSAMQVQTSLSL